MLNLSHGALYLLAAYLAHWAASQGIAGGNAGAAYTFAIATTALLGGLLFHFVIRTATSPARIIVLCLAVNFALAEVLRSFFGTRGILVPEALGGTVTVAGVPVARQQLLVLPGGVLLLAATAFVVYRTPAGRAIRAVAQDREAAEITGIPAVPVLGWTFVVSAGMAGLAACLIAPLTVIGPGGWISPLVKSFAVVVLGGTRRLRGVVAAALVLATAEVATALWISEGAAEYMSILIIVAVLVARPKGIFVEGGR